MSYYEPLRSFELHMPSRVLFGINYVEKIGVEAKRFGAAKVLVVTDKGVSKTGAPERVRALLAKEGLSAEVWDNAETEPSIGSVVGLRDHIMKGGFDLLIGLGGGSCMDMAKAAAVLSRNEGDPEDYFSGGKTGVHEAGDTMHHHPHDGRDRCRDNVGRRRQGQDRHQGSLRTRVHNADAHHRRPHHVGEHATEAHRLLRH